MTCIINIQVDTSSSTCAEKYEPAFTDSFFREHLLGKENRLSISGWLKIMAATGLDIPYLGYLELEMETTGIVLPECGYLVVKYSMTCTVLQILSDVDIVDKTASLVFSDVNICSFLPFHSNRVW